MSRLKRILAFAALLAVVVAIGLWIAWRPDIAQRPVEAVSGPKPDLSGVRIQNLPTVRIAKPLGWPAGRTPVAAPGLAVNEFAGGLDHPRWIYELPNGDVLVAETDSPPLPKEGITDWVMSLLMRYAGSSTPSANRITLLRDVDGDGRAEVRTALLTGLNSPFGMLFKDGRLYVGNHDALVWFPMTLGQTRITAPSTLVAKLPGGDDHWTKNIFPSPNGRDILVAVGSASNIAERGMERERNRAAILEISPVNGGQRIYTAGLRNPVGMAATPDGRIFTAVNERDMMGSDMPPDYLALVDFGAFYGWPWSYWGGFQDRRVEQTRPDLRQYTRRPDYALGPHTASLGLAWGSVGQFQNGMFVGQHGSWNREPKSGYKVIFVPFNARGWPEGAMQDVLTGFLTADQKGAYGRPVGVAARRGGDLLVADDAGNKIWRVSAAR